MNGLTAEDAARLLYVMVDQADLRRVLFYMADVGPLAGLDADAASRLSEALS